MSVRACISILMNFVLALTFLQAPFQHVPEIDLKWSSSVDEGAIAHCCPFLRRLLAKSMQAHLEQTTLFIRICCLPFLVEALFSPVDALVH